MVSGKLHWGLHPETSMCISSNEWRLRGNTVSRVDSSVLPWVAHVRWIPGAKEAILLRAKLDDDQFFPSATHSNLVFETNYKLNLPLPRMPSK
jgi:hypothetical protein